MGCPTNSSPLGVRIRLTTCRSAEGSQSCQARLSVLSVSSGAQMRRRSGMRCRHRLLVGDGEWPGVGLRHSRCRHHEQPSPTAPPSHEGLPSRGGRPAALPGGPARARLSAPTHPPVVRPRTSTLRRQLPRRRRGSCRLRTPSQPFCERNPRRTPGRSVWPRSRRRMAACALAWLRYTGRTRLARAHPHHGYRRGAPSGRLQPLPGPQSAQTRLRDERIALGAPCAEPADEATRLLRRGGLACDPFATCGRSAASERRAPGRRPSRGPIETAGHQDGMPSGRRRRRLRSGCGHRAW